jgi:hypothetical protein
LRRVRETGRKVLLVTGRELSDVLALLPEPQLFDRIVAENGAILYRPSSREERVLGEPPPDLLVSELTRRRVAPLSVGRVVVSTQEPNEIAVLEVIRQLGLERQVIFNKGAVMILPSGMNKASGLDAALEELGLSRHNCVAVGDAENDHAFLSRAECAVAVANALPALKDIADLVTAEATGLGVRELIEQLVASDLEEVDARLARHFIPLGSRQDGSALGWPPYGRNLLVAGPSGSGKSTFTSGVLERLAEKGYQYCIIDPEGDYVSLPGAVVLGNADRAPTVAEMLDVLKGPGQNVVVNLLGISLESRPEFFVGALARLRELRIKVGRPHWIVADEAHHLMPLSWSGAPLGDPPGLGGMLLITVHPREVSTPVMAAIDAVVAVGGAPRPVIREFATAIRRPAPAAAAETLEPGEVLLWAPASGTLERLRGMPSKSERRRHLRKYFTGELDEDRSFYFRGRDNKLNLRAQNLALFLQVGEGVDEATWLHHLHRGDFSRWMRTAIKDEELAAEVEETERRTGLSAAVSRALVREAVSKRYTT